MKTEKPYYQVVRLGVDINIHRVEPGKFVFRPGFAMTKIKFPTITTAEEWVRNELNSIAVAGR